MAGAIERSSAAVVLGYFFHMTDATLEYRLEPGEIERRLKRLVPSRYPLIARTGPDAGPVGFLKAYAPESNLELFSAVAASSGYFSLRSDPDGVLRWVPLVIQGGEDLFPPLAVACAWQYLGRPRLTLKVDRHGVEGVQMGDRFIPTDEAGQLLVNYLGPPRTFARFSVTDILKGQVPPGTFKDRIVLVGATALGTYDLRNTPFSPLYPGTEVHASVIDNILTQRFMARPERREDLRSARHCGLGSPGRVDPAAVEPAAGPGVRRWPVHPLRGRRSLALRARARVAQHGLSLTRALGHVHGADRLRLSHRDASAQARQGDLPAIRGDGSRRGNAQGAEATATGGPGEGPHRALQRPGGLHHSLRALCPARDGRDAERVL